MRKLKISTCTGYILLLFISLLYKTAIAQNQSGKAFELKDGDRVVFLGNSIFENDFQYGYLELALTTRFHDRFATFRNLGWTGDNVFGDARSTFTNPPTAYDHLIQNITKAQPTVVFLAYGGVEAQDGEEGLPRFKKGLNNLLNKIDSLGAKTILLSPIPVLSSDSTLNPAKRNADIQLYAAAISQIASARGKQFIDIYKPFQEISKKETITENGIHLNETGYYYLAGMLEKGLGLKSGVEPVTINISKQGIALSANAKKLTPGNDLSGLKFAIQEDYLPLPYPAQYSGVADQAQIIKITGLKKGFYTLKADDSDLVTASAKAWEEGVTIKRGISADQVKQLRRMIVKKNDLFFFQYRPMNETYIIGFRAYEQGKHVKDLDDQSILIKFLESQIALDRTPKAHSYQLSQVGERQ
ncbi:GDSL-type esterase/lipase family protein [Dyadobacter sp. LHD-138]|uniref:GDSL-type esterase/lipase family protein n=1 Tax=Dyadobacter sp. LHD-138 TaxID=3071413 RepID=UPI0027E042A2|nr:GDSL-type esterase/lipase family protein [Dyadobacter sp. LHD-138]MDQ6481227.1 GDSL-type esterase/lipase family protein [Dyadobacter sp. LHD-138]